MWKAFLFNFTSFLVFVSNTPSTPICIEAVFFMKVIHYPIYYRIYNCDLLEKSDHVFFKIKKTRFVCLIAGGGTCPVERKEIPCKMYKVYGLCIESPFVCLCIRAVVMFRTARWRPTAKPLGICRFLKLFSAQKKNILFGFIPSLENTILYVYGGKRIKKTQLREFVLLFVPESNLSTWCENFEGYKEMIFQEFH